MLTLEIINEALNNDKDIYRGILEDLYFIKIYNHYKDNFGEHDQLMNYIYSTTDEELYDYNIVNIHFTNANAAIHAMKLELTKEDLKSKFLNKKFSNSYQIDNCLNFKNKLLEKIYLEENFEDLLRLLNSPDYDLILCKTNFDDDLDLINETLNNLKLDLCYYLN